ncbi:hypothetical protein Tco_0786136, partial [Tanacetum coccineum]
GPTHDEANASFFLILRDSANILWNLEGSHFSLESDRRGGPEGQDDQDVTSPPLTNEQIEGHLSPLKSLIKNHSRSNKTDPIRLDFEEEDIKARDNRIVKGKEAVDDELKKPFKESLRTPLTCRIIEVSARGWFERLSANSINEWSDLREAFAAKYSVRRACFREPHEITKIARRANESLTAFKKRWTIETGFIMGVLEIMKIPSFMVLLKCTELANHFLDKAPTTVNEMMGRLDDFVRFEKDFAQTELPKGETGEQH